MRNKPMLRQASALAIVMALGGTAGAADLYEPSAAVAVSPDGIHDWSGAYIGGHFGYGKANSYWFDSVSDRNNDGNVLGGLQAGYLWQMQNGIVWGAEIDGSATGLFGGDWDYAVAETDWLGSLRARLGFAFDDILIYATGGAGLVVGNAASSETTHANDSFAKLTGVVGGGVEWAYDDRLSVRGEGLYYTETGKFSAGDDNGKIEGIWAARIGVNFKLTR